MAANLRTAEHARRFNRRFRWAEPLDPKRQPTVDAGVAASKCPPDPRIALHASGYGDFIATRSDVLPLPGCVNGRILPKL